MKRVSSRAVIFIDNKLVVFKRRKNGLEYYSLPGGGLEENETIEECVLREVYEEYSCHGTILGKLGRYEDNNSIQYYFHMSIEGTPMLGGEELLRNCPENSYIVCYLNMDEINKSNIYNKDLILNAYNGKYIDKFIDK